MESNDHEETQPYSIPLDGEDEAAHLETTMPTPMKSDPVSTEQPGEGDPAQTMPLHLEDMAESEPGTGPGTGFEETIPPPLVGVAPVSGDVETDDAGMTVPTQAAPDSPDMDDAPPPPPEAGAMEDDEAGMTVPTQAAPDSYGTDDAPPPPPAGGRPSPLRWMAIIGVMLLILIATGSAYAGYQSGINQRTGAESVQISQQVQEQFDLGVQDMEARRFDLARQRFEYVIQYDPSYPGVTEQLAEVLLLMNSTATPTVAPTPTITPTPDTRGIDEIHSQAQEHLANGEWTLAIDTLLALRTVEPGFQPVWVDGNLYVAFINRGQDKILRDGDLEGGIYDLRQAEQIGPLDADSKSYLTWARLYITGATFWELDWAQSVYYFAQIAPALPNLRDGSGWTATERLRLALAGYGDFLTEQGEYCAALEQYEMSLGMGSDSLIEEARDAVAEACNGGDRDRSSGQSDPDPQPTATNPPPAATTPPPAATEPPPTGAPPTQAPPTQAPPTQSPPTQSPPTQPPPTQPPPTQPPPTESPPPEATPTPNS